MLRRCCSEYATRSPNCTRTTPGSPPAQSGGAPVSHAPSSTRIPTPAHWSQRPQPALRDGGASSPSKQQPRLKPHGGDGDTKPRSGPSKAAPETPTHANASANCPPGAANPKSPPPPPHSPRP